MDKREKERVGDIASNRWLDVDEGEHQQQQQDENEEIRDTPPSLLKTK